MLNVQEYLLKRKDYKTAINDLVSHYHIVVKEYDDMIVLNYDMIDSPRFNKLADDCRGLILSKDFKTVYCRPFTRFYNFGEENITDFDFKNSFVYEKLDGTLMSLYYHPVKNIWNVSTRKMANAEGITSFGNTFRSLFMKGMDLDPEISNEDFTEYMEKRIDKYKNFTFIFEMTSPETRVVKHYNTYQDYLIGVRCNNTSDNKTYEDINVFVNLFENVKLPKSYSFSNKNDIIDSIKELEPLDEGYVVFNPNDESRVKVKSPTYVAVHHLKGNGLNLKKVAVLVFNKEYKEYLAYFPEEEYIFTPYIEAFEHMKHEVIEYFDIYNPLKEQKKFALAIKDLPFNSLLFKMRKGKTFREICEELSDDKKFMYLNMFIKNKKK